MSSELNILLITAAYIGFFHTILGPDHYLPFIVMSKSRGWSLRKTSLITFLCGVGHVSSSVVIGILGAAFGVALSRIKFLEAFRGSFAAWALISFGFVYLIYGIRQAVKNKPHSHSHLHKGGIKHSHSHTHSNGHVHLHESRKNKSITPWVLFTIFVLGPCEPLIPVLMYPALENSLTGLIMVTSVFTAVTVGTMMSVVVVSFMGISLTPLWKIERYVHALAGGTVFLSGISIQFLGL